MEYGCPVCNGLTEKTMPCPECGELMKDDGMVENYYGPYSPYENTDTYEPPLFWELAPVLPCVHLFSCPLCGRDTRVAFPQVVMG
ncbi:MAG: hypothetical protein M1609_09490 [Firmicutes bacterium]|nr:hypothetical protein [Bacillota bacterium]